MLIKSDSHAVGSAIQWRVKYDKWLANTAYISQASVSSSDTNYTVSGVLVEGKDIVFIVTGGALGVAVTLTITMRDNLGNVLPDTINLIGVAP